MSETPPGRPQRRHVDGMINLMRGLQPPTVAQQPATDAELSLLGLTRAEYEESDS